MVYFCKITRGDLTMNQKANVCNTEIFFLAERKIEFLTPKHAY
jgi:hypothetical protein